MNQRTDYFARKNINHHQKIQNKQIDNENNSIKPLTLTLKEENDNYRGYNKNTFALFENRVRRQRKNNPEGKNNFIKTAKIVLNKKTKRHDFGFNEEKTIINNQNDFIILSNNNKIFNNDLSIINNENSFFILSNNNKLFSKDLSIINNENDFFILSNNNTLVSKDLQKNDFFF